jgi:hypothetical protein
MLMSQMSEAFACLEAGQANYRRCAQFGVSWFIVNWNLRGVALANERDGFGRLRLFDLRSGCAAMFVAYTQSRGAHCRPLDPWLASSRVVVHATDVSLAACRWRARRSLAAELKGDGSRFNK